ncbi:glycosyltransferase family 4 protein [Almyronema epifaneia]|uniref:Glycosyltransferase family 4 protein n=1 Tax=Almyronema epifaneia S1 TaxID=2991925 RepID=A0ABW6IAN5_9CYAN
MSILLKVKRKLFSIKMNLLKFGFKGYCKYALKRLKASILGKPDQLEGKTDIISYYSFVSYQPFGNRHNAALLKDKKSINWVIPDFSVGSGGHINIFRFIDGLEKRNYNCSITIIEPCQFLEANVAKERINQNFRPLQAEVFIGKENMPPAWITFATSWTTAYAVRNFQSTVHKCYFVQDFEPFFYARSSEYYWAEETYKFGFYGVTAGKWLAQKLAKSYSMKTDYVGFSYDKDLYAAKSEKTDSEVKKIFFYARPVTPRRGFELGLLTLTEVSKCFPDVEFVLAGWDTTSYHIPFKHISLGVVSLKELPDIYSRCYAALVLSFTNLSLLPLELMACRCPVVSNSGSNVSWLLNEQNCLLAEPNVESLSTALCSLLRNEDRREKIADAGLNFALSTSWDVECDRFSTIVDRMIND